MLSFETVVLVILGVVAAAELLNVLMLGRLRGLGESRVCSRREGKDIIKQDHVAEKSLENNETRDSPLRTQCPPSPDLSPRIAQRRRFGGTGEGLAPTGLSR
jgi:hypothetical protein